MNVIPFYDEATATFTWLVVDETTNSCAIIDPVLDYNPESGHISTVSADRLLAYITDKELKVEWLLETHIHADHLTAAHYLKTKTQAPIGIGANIIEVLDYWVPIFNTQNDTPRDGSQFDHLFTPDEGFSIGTLQARILFTPGHTPACITYVIEDAAFVGDTLFMPYVGTSRADFPGGNATMLYDSIQKILSLPKNTRLFTGHDYPKDGKPACGESTIEEQRKYNIMIHDGIGREDYIERRTQRDATLSVPRLILPAIQTNLRAGALGTPEANGRQYLKIPVNLF